MRGRGRRRRGRLRSLCEEVDTEEERFEANLKEKTYCNHPLENIAIHVFGWKTSLLGWASAMLRENGSILPATQWHGHKAKPCHLERHQSYALT